MGVIKFKILFLIGMVFSLCLLFVSCAIEKNEEFPSEQSFSTSIEVVSVTEYGKDYKVKLNTILKNESDSDFIIYGNPSCWNTLYVNGTSAPYDLPAGTYKLLGKSQLVEEKTIILSSEEYLSSEMYFVSQFSIKHNDKTEKEYAIKSKIYILKEGNLNK